MRKVLIVGNWKMHLNTHEASLLVHHLQTNIPAHKDIEVVLAPSLLTLQPISTQIDRRKFRLAAQNAYFKDEGAYTGEVSFNMLRELVHYTIIGHSERRHIFNESLPLIRDKVKACVRNGITPILCIGETEQERSDGETKQVLHDQLSSALSELGATQVGEMVIAYEPVWAIGTGKIASPADAQAASQQIHSYISDVFGEEAGREVRVLYGGSVTPEFIEPFLDDSNIDGFLVGGASLRWPEFSSIVERAYAWQRKGGDIGTDR